MDRVTYLILARENNHHGGISSDEQKDFTGGHSATNTSGRNNGPNTTQQNELTCRSFHFNTDKPSSRDTILPKKIRKVTIQHQRRRGKNRQTLAETTQKEREGKKKVPTTILLFQGLRIFLYKWEPNADGPTSTDLWHNQTLW